MENNKSIHIIPTGLSVALCGSKGRGSSFGMMSNCAECLKAAQKINNKEQTIPMKSEEAQNDV